MLIMHTISHPARHNAKVKVFRNWEAAYRHVRDHLLTAPECELWALVEREYQNIVDPADGKERRRLSERAEESKGAAAQPLYDLYCSAIGRDAESARRLHWLSTREQLTPGFGNRGIYFLIEAEAIKTAYLPGFGDPEGTRRSQDTDNLNPNLPRERRTGKLRGGKPIAAAPRHEQKWNYEQRLFYRVFRPCLNWLKRQQPDPDKDETEQCYLWLKERLPKRSQFKFEDWQKTL